MKEITFEEINRIQGGDVVFNCFVMGVVFGISVSTGSLAGAIGSGLYLANNCFV